MASYYSLTARSGLALKAFSITLALLSLTPLKAIATGITPPCTPYTYDCSYCAATACSCSYPMVTVSAQNVVQVPFSWSHGDTNTDNDDCSGTTNSCHCNAGTTSYSASQLPAPSGVCAWSDPKQLPATVTCQWRDGSCGTACTNWVSQTCSGCR